jgi:S1-C subfamily serine protease
VAWHSPTTISTAQSGSSSSLPGLGDGGTGNSGSGSGTSPFSFGSGGGSSSGGTTTQGSGSPSDVSTIAAEVSPALVDVNSTFGYQSAEGAGTGIVLTSTGEILTNNHVINGATSISVTDIGNGKTYSATVVGYDSTHDVAVLQLANASGLKTAKLADSSKVAVGAGVVAIGNAGGTGGTPSSAGGSVTAQNQSITASDELDGTSEQLSGLIEVNADVQSGDSGGSLVNSSGEVIGMDTAASSTYSFQSSSGSSGYAIPINEALSIAGQIKDGQSSADVHIGSTAFLGVLVTPPSSSSSSGGSSSGQTQSGAAVEGVLSGTTAANAGLVKGDTITSLDGQNVSSASTLTKIVGSLKPGQNVQLGWVDSSGQSHTATVDMGSGPPA